ncbi:MAG: acetate--CoA ligase [Steroidobacteraceae bacterium]
MSKKNIESVLLEQRSFPPPKAFSARARLGPRDFEALQRRAAADPVEFWSELARAEIHWQKMFTVGLDDSQAPNYRWFTDGELNVSFNCLDVHLAEHGHRTAILFEGEPGDSRRISYRELHADVCRFANVLKAQGLRRGDRVVIYMPMVPEAVIAMQACARIGVIHSVVFGGFSALSLKERIEDAGARCLITADAGWRGGQKVELKAAVDKALAMGCGSIESVIVLQRTGHDIPMVAGRDYWWHDLIVGQSPACEPEWVDAEHPLFLLYTSGSTGRPKGVQHSTAGFLLGAKLTTEWVFDIRHDDVFWCTADVGWVTGHSYVCYGPLAAGATLVMYEGAPTYPDGGRFWKICEQYGVTIFYTAPTAIRALMKLGDGIPAEYDLSKIRLLGSVGEPINPEAWMWYRRVIGRNRCPIVDTWWQTETGTIMISPVPGVTATKPGSCTYPLPGIFADIVDDEGRSVTRPDAGGYLVIRKPWPSMLRTIWGDNARYLSTYWEKFQNRYYVAGDSAHRDADGCFWIMGRIDDVLNVAGHRLGTMEIESALVAHPRIAEAAVVGRPHEIKGEAVSAFVVCRGARPQAGEAVELAKALRDWVAEQLGAIARPEEIRFADNLPKTRSGKIMRRLLRTIARGEDIKEDISTLENPAIIDQLRAPAAGAASIAAAPAVAVKPKAKAKARAKAKAKLKAKAVPVVKAKPKAKAKRKARSGGRARTKSQAGAVSRARVKSKAKSKEKAKPIAKSNSQSRSRQRPRKSSTIKAGSAVAARPRAPARGK